LYFFEFLNKKNHLEFISQIKRRGSTSRKFEFRNGRAIRLELGKHLSIDE